MKIDQKFIKQIFALKIKLKEKKDKIALSKYEDLIPMYDIYSQSIYPITKSNIHYRLIDSHYRFINDEIYLWIKNLFDKYKDDKYKTMLSIIDNYDIPTLIETSYKTFYKYSPSLGLQISICKRNSFHPFISHLKPYYSKMELVKLGQNQDIIKKDIDIETLLDREEHYSVCKKVSQNDVSFDEIKKHTEHIIDSNASEWFTYYSFTGSFMLNRFLRNMLSNKETKLNPFLLNGLNQIVSCIKNSPPLTNDYFMYRFIWSSSFLDKLQPGDYFIDTGFMSTTRDPFYSPGLNGNFGLVLLKIYLPKNVKGIGIFMENLSLFPKEEEFLLPPFSRFRLINKNENFTYYHTNEQFQKLIKTKYEFELVSNDYTFVNNIQPLIYDIQELDLSKIELEGNFTDRIDLINNFIKKYGNKNNQIIIKHNNKKYLCNYNWFDATSGSAYEKLYYNKVREGIVFNLGDHNNPYPIINVELGTELCVNYINKKYFYTGSKTELSNEHLDIILEFGRIFKYKDAKVFHTFRNFSNKDNQNKMFKQINHFNYTIYDYLKNKNKFLKDIFTYYNYSKLDDFMKKPVEQSIIDKMHFDVSNMNNAQLFIHIVENEFNLYNKIIQIFNTDIFDNEFIIYKINEKLQAENRIEQIIELEHDEEHEGDENFKLVFRQPIRRVY